jgi:photosystem II stability/assembly factor-like uncharacterized protein
MMLIALTAACDDDPSAPATADLTGNFAITPDTIGIQEAIRVVFNRPIDPATALDQANFVVTNLCDTLRVPGAVRLSGDTLIFSPSQQLPYLALLSIRVQNILDERGIALRQPIVFQRITQPPPVSDASWAFMNSPTNDLVTGIGFADPDLGYIVTFGGSVYRTVNGGQFFEARFKQPDITDTYGVRTFGGDTVVMLGAILVGGSPRWSVFRSFNAAQSFETANTVSALLYNGRFQELGGEVLGVVGGQGNASAVFKYRLSTNTLTQATGTPTSGSVFFTDAALSADTTTAVAVFYDFLNNRGFASRSVDGGASYSAVTLPTTTQALFGTGFVDNNTAFLVGDSSEVLRLDVASGTVTELGAAQGIPQTQISGSSTTAFGFTRAEFAPDGQLGWIVGFEVLRRPGVADAIQGVVLQTRDGGQSWTRQAIAGAPNNGLAFPPVYAMHALSRDFAVLSGDNGLVAARIDDTRPAAAACSFTQP